MPIFRVEKSNGYTVMSNHHLRNKELTLKAKGLLSQMLSLPDDWDYTLKGLAFINREQIDAIREAVKELETAGYIVRSRERDEKGRLRGADYVIYEKQLAFGAEALSELRAFQQQRGDPAHTGADRGIETAWGKGIFRLDIRRRARGSQQGGKPAANLL